MQTRYSLGTWEILQGRRCLVRLYKDGSFTKFYYELDRLCGKDTVVGYDRTLVVPINSLYHMKSYYYNHGSVYEYVYRTKDMRQVASIDTAPGRAPYYTINFSTRRFEEYAEWTREVYNIIDQHE